MAKSTKTTKAPDAQPGTFDEKANEQLIITERAAREAGKKVEEKRFIIAEGKTIRKGGKFYGGGEAIDLSPADAERFLFHGDVLQADSKEAKAAAAVKEEQIQAAKDAGAAGELQ